MLFRSDPYFDNVVLLLHCDGADGSTTFTDVKGHTCTANGNAQIDTAQSKFGGASALFDGTGDYLSVADSSDWDLASSQSFTAECWYRPAAIGANCAIISMGSSHLLFVNASTGMLRCPVAGINSSTGYLTTGSWHHCAVTRDGAAVKLFLDRKSTRLNSSHIPLSRMPSSA